MNDGTEEPRSNYSSYSDHVLDPEQVSFYRNERGRLVLRIGTDEYTAVNLRLAFPLEAEEEFIDLSFPDGTELGMLERLSDLDPESQQALRDELKKIYFRPKVVTVGKLVEEHGVLNGQIHTTSGSRSLEIRGWRENVRLLSNNRAIIEDVDGNRYLIEDWRTLPKVTKEILGL